MKRLLLPILLGLPLWLAACGYQNPYLAARHELAALESTISAPVTMHAQMWSNRTNEPRLPLVFYNSIANWFQKSGRIRLASGKEKADYSIRGEIISINEGLTRGIVRLTVGYYLHDLKNNETVWRIPGQTFSESYFIEESAAQTQNNKQRALEKIADDLAESIYMRTLHHLRDSENVPSAE